MSVAARSISRPIAPDFLGLALRVQRHPRLGGTRDGAAQPRSRPAHPQPRPGRPPADPRRRAQHRPFVVAGPGHDASRSAVTDTLTPAWAQSLRSLVAGARRPARAGRQPRGRQPAAGPDRGRRVRAGLSGGATSTRWTSATSRPCTRACPGIAGRAGTSSRGTPTTGRPSSAAACSWGPATFVTEYARILDALPPDPDRRPRHAARRLVRRLSAPLPRSALARADARVARVRAQQLRHQPGVRRLPVDPAPAQRLCAARSPQHAHSRTSALAHRNGATFRIDEMGSVTCNGRRGRERHDGIRAVGGGRAVQRRPGRRRRRQPPHLHGALQRAL